MNKWKYLLIYVLFAAVLAVIVFMVWVGTAQSGITCPTCIGYGCCDDGIIHKYQREYLPLMFANAFPTPAPTQNPFPTITYPPPVTPVP